MNPQPYQKLLRTPAWIPTESQSPACADIDPELWFPDQGGSHAPAERICMGCEVRFECASAGLEQDERFGVWGGLSALERQEIRRDRR